MQPDKLGTSPAVWAGIDGASGTEAKRDGMATIPPRGSEVGLVVAEVEQTAPSCLVLEDDAVLRRLLSRHLSHRGYRVTGAQNLAEARAALAAHDFQFILSDSMLPDGSGLDFVAELAERNGHPAVLVMSGDKRAERVRRGRGATAFLLKPFSMQSLDTTLTTLDGEAKLLRLARSGPDLERVERFRTRYLPELGRDVAAIAALDALSKLPCPVLLVSDDPRLASVCARALYDAGAKPGDTCQELDAQMLDTALEFDAQLSAANAGTLVLARLERMPLLVQSRLLALLSEGELERPNEKERLRLRPRLLLTLVGERDVLVITGKLHPELSLWLARTEIRVTGSEERT
jgi:DNA-binding NtrC family response regulator